jgi:hypothetical protein
MSKTLSLHTFKWVLPTSIRSRTNYFEIDITKSCQVFFNKEEYYSRKITFDKQSLFNKETTEKITDIKLKIHPFTIAPMSNDDQAAQIIEKEIGTFPDLQHIIDRGNLRIAHGLVIVEIKFLGELIYPENLNRHEEKDIEKVLNWNMEFEYLKLELISIANDVCSFFLLCLHITYPTHSNMHATSKPQSSGLVSMQGTSRYIMDVHSDMMSYPLFMEADRLPALETVLPQIGEVWHKNIWTFHRFIKAVRSDYMTIDNLLDLVFTFESMFGENMATETMRLIASVIAAKDKQEAMKFDRMIANAFIIRNAVAHGGEHYRLYDKLPKGKDTDKMILDVFWALKNLNITLISYGIHKLINDKNPIPTNAIRFGIDDIIDKCFDVKPKKTKDKRSK